MYCFAFDRDLMQEWEWSGKYPEQPEILAYLGHVADRFDLRRNTSFDTRVHSAHFDEANNRWDVETDTGERYRSRFLITAIGCLSTGQIPDFPGRDTFTGEAYHTGAWPHEGVDFAGKKEYDAIYDKARHSTGGFPYDVQDRSALDVDETERQRSGAGPEAVAPRSPLRLEADPDRHRLPSTSTSSIRPSLPVWPPRHRAERPRKRGCS